MLDGDYTYPAKYLPLIVSLLYAGADVVIGYRQNKIRGSMTRMNRFGNTALSLLARILYGRPIKDVCTGMWGFKTSVLKSFHLTSDKFTLEADMFINTVKGGYSFGQIPIDYRPREVSSQTKLKVSDGVKIALFLIKSRVWRTG